MDSTSKPITIKNTGKYAISFNFSIKKASTREVLCVVPEAGNIDPGKEVVVQVSRTGRCFLKTDSNVKQ